MRIEVGATEYGTEEGGICEVSVSNLGRDTDCADRDFVALFCVKVIGLQSFNGTWPRALLWPVLRATRGKHTKW